MVTCQARQTARPRDTRKNLHATKLAARGLSWDAAWPIRPGPVFVIDCSRSGITVTYETLAAVRQYLTHAYETPPILERSAWSAQQLMGIRSCRWKVYAARAPRCRISLLPPAPWHGPSAGQDSHQHPAPAPSPQAVSQGPLYIHTSRLPRQHQLPDEWLAPSSARPQTAYLPKAGRTGEYWYSTMAAPTIQSRRFWEQITRLDFVPPGHCSNHPMVRRPMNARASGSRTPCLRPSSFRTAPSPAAARKSRRVTNHSIWPDWSMSPCVASRISTCGCGWPRPLVTRVSTTH